MPTKTKAVMFASRFKQLRVVMEAGDYDWKGNRIHGEIKGRTIEFDKGVRRTDDEDEIAFLREKIADGDPNLWEIPDQVPDPSPLLVELFDASEDRVREILEAELEGWERPQVIEVCEKRLNAPTSDPPAEGDDADPDAPFGYRADGEPRKGPGGRPRKAD